jgi:putative CocE/NonD family hydrolase
LLGNVLFDPYSKRKSEDKHNICFDTAPLEKSLTITGNPVAKIFVKPNGKDCSLCVYLEDVGKDGSVNYVTEGEILCGNTLNPSYTPKYKTVSPMRSFQKADYLEFSPREVRQVDLELFPMSYQFRKGHRIRLSIAGGDKNHFKLPSFVQLCDQFDIICGKPHASQISLPVESVH